MREEYRNAKERAEIIRAAIAETAKKPLSDYGLSDSELVFFRARSARAVEALARRTSAFKAYYTLPTAKPFAVVVVASAVVVASVIFAGVYAYIATRHRPAYPIFAALITISAVAAGWAVTGWMTHRNTIRQNTNTMVTARFTQAPFNESLYRFHRQFGFEETHEISPLIIKNLRETGSDDDWKAASSIGYLLNYFEFVANGVLRGDFDQAIIKDNFRGVISFYHDKCWPVIKAANDVNTMTYANLIKLRTHYREP